MWLNNVNLLVTRTISYWWNISSLHSLPEWSFDLGYTHNTHGISTLSSVTNPCENLPGWIIKRRSQQDENAAQKHDNAGSKTWPVDNGVVEGVTSSKNGGGSRVQTRRQRTAVEWSCAPTVGNVALTKKKQDFLEEPLSRKKFMLKNFTGIFYVIEEWGILFTNWSMVSGISKA